MADYYVREEDGTSKYILEDASGDYLLETSVDSVAPDFIASVAAVYAPAVASATVAPSFIASATAVNPPTLTDLSVVVPFVTSTTVVRAPTLITNQVIVATFGGPAFGWAFFAEGSPRPPQIEPSFIASVTVVRAPTVASATITPSFIASVTTLYALAFSFGGSTVVSTAGTYTWLCPAGVTTIHVDCYGAGGGGGSGSFPGVGGAEGGGGGAYAGRVAVPVTPGNSYTFVVGAGGLGATALNASGSDGSDTTFTGDSGTQVIAKAGKGGAAHGGAVGAGGQASGSTGDTGLKFSGGDGGPHSGGNDGGGGGASGNHLATGASGVAGPGGGGAGANGGGSGGAGGTPDTNDATAGNSPGGGGGAGGTSDPGGPGSGKNGADGTVVITPPVLPAFISSVTVLYGPEISELVGMPFISSVTAVYTPTLSTISTTVSPPFISSHTVVYPIFNLFDPNKTYGGPGNGGESFPIELNANGVTTTATLASSIAIGLGALSMTGDSGLPATVAFIATIDSEQLLLFPRGGGNYTIQGRGMGNTTASSHTAGATVSWGDTYQQAIRAGFNINASFTADITGSGSILYPGWLICFDSSQAYLTGDRYPMHVTQVEGVFAAGAGIGGSNKLDAAQPNAVSTPTGVSDDCPAALSNPARIQTDIVPGDVAVVSYTNPEATPLDLGPRSTALQSWFGMKRVDLTDHDVTFTDPNGIVVDTTGTYDTFTGSVNGEWFEPDSIGIGPFTGTPTPNTVPYTSVTLPGTDRKFTFGSGGGGYDETGWPICCLAVRQGSKRVPFWQSWDWHNYNYVYAGFGTDDTYAQILINRNGIVFGSVPEVELPGPQDIDGPDAVWDDKEYYFGASWYVAIYNGVYLLVGPGIGGAEIDFGIPGSDDGFVPVVTFPGGVPATSVPPQPEPVEGGSGGDIGNPPSGLHVWGTSGKGFS